MSGRCPSPSGHRLTGRTEERRAVHELDPPDRRPAPVTRLALAAVGVQRAVEVPGLAVDVDVERVEAGPSLDQRRAHHGPRLGEHAAYVDRPQPVSWAVPVDPGPP